MLSRIVQLLARLVALACLAVVGFMFGEPSPETVSSINGYSIEIATALVGFGALLFDLMIHRVETGGVLKKASEKAPPAKSGNSLNLPLLLLAFVPAAALVGCGTDPTFIAASRNYHDTIGDYVYEKVAEDPEISPQEKTLFIQRHDSYGKLLDVKEHEMKIPIPGF